MTGTEPDTTKTVIPVMVALYRQGVAQLAGCRPWQLNQAFSLLFLVVSVFLVVSCERAVFAHNQGLQYRGTRNYSPPSVLSWPLQSPKLTLDP